MTPARKIRLLMELRRAGITDTGVLSALERIPRDLFAPDAFRDQAYENRTLPIGHGQTLSKPGVVALMTQALACTRSHKVLEIGTGSGYQAAVLSRLCRRLYSIERYADLLELAEARFSALGLTNITTKVDDGSLGWPGQAPFHRIIVTAAAPEVPAALADQLGEGGIMIVPLGGRRGDQDLVRVVKERDGLREESLGPVHFVPLVSGPPPMAPGQGRRLRTSGR
jgi:protein-L-isoaspartate(D-aspartate) O-methyltransferase